MLMETPADLGSATYHELEDRSAQAISKPERCRASGGSVRDAEDTVSPAARSHVDTLSTTAGLLA